MRSQFTAREREALRRRFDQDQADAEFVEYTEAMERIATPRRWRRTRTKFLEARGYAHD